MRKLILPILITTLTLAVAVGAIAEEMVVSQKGRMFSTNLMTVHRGAFVTFVNDDTVPHNIMSTSRINGFDLGSQMPGTAVPVSFDVTGIVAVICVIHPRMRMTIEIVD
jgi:plastocyanin